MSNFDATLIKNICKVNVCTGHGTGFLISDNKIITATHCIDSATDEKIFLEFSAICSEEIKVEATPEYYDNSCPIVVLKIKFPQKFDHLSIAKMPLKKSYKCDTFGYPKGNTFHGVPVPMEIIRVIEENHVQPADNSTIILKYDSNTRDFPGLSGAPLIVDQTVVGVMAQQSIYSKFGATSLKAVELKNWESYLNKCGIELPSKNKIPEKPLQNNSSNTYKTYNNNRGIMSFGNGNNITMNN